MVADEPHGSAVVRSDHSEGLKCHAVSKSTGRQCGRFAIRGATVCDVHGGAAGQVRAAARRRVVVAAIEADVAAVVAAEGLEPIADPLEALGLLASRAEALMDAMGARVNALSELRFEDEKGAEQLRSEVALYERSMDRCAKFLNMLIKAGFMERRVQVQEGTADAVVGVLRRVFERLELTPAQLVLVGEVVPEELRSLES